MREEQANIEIGELLRNLAAGFAATGNPVEYRQSGSGITQVRINALTRVLHNLIENAVTYSGEKAVILDWSAADENLFIWQQTTDPEFLSKSGKTYSSRSTG